MTRRQQNSQKIHYFQSPKDEKIRPAFNDKKNSKLPQHIQFFNYKVPTKRSKYPADCSKFFQRRAKK